MTTISNTNAQLASSILSSLGVGNGININSIVTQLVAAEGQPFTSMMNTQTSAVNTKLSGISQLRSALSSFQSVVTGLQSSTNLQANTVTSSDETLLTASSTGGAQVSNHSIVVSQLATQQRAVFASSTDVVGASGSLDFTMGSGDKFSVDIDSSNNSLAGIASAINNATDNKGVAASIITVDSGTPGTTIDKLVLTATNSGSANSFTIAGSNTDNTTNTALSQLASSFPKTPALDAIVKIDGETATRSSNTITDILSGVTLNLKATSSTPVDVNISLNSSAVSSALSSFVSAYNNLNNSIQSLQAFGGVGGTNGALFGDSNIELIAKQVRTLSTEKVSTASGAYNSLAMIGVTVDQKGVMSLDSTKLNAALTANPKAVVNVFNSTDGITNKLNLAIVKFTSSSGSLGTKLNVLNSQLTDLQKRQAAQDKYLASYQTRLQHEYGAMQTLVSQYSSTGSFLTSWINSNSSSSSKG